MGLRKSQVMRLLRAQREFDDSSRGRPGYSEEGMRKAAAVIGAAWRNASEEERRAFRARCGPDGRARREDG